MARWSYCLLLYLGVIQRLWVQISAPPSCPCWALEQFGRKNPAELFLADMLAKTNLTKWHWKINKVNNCLTINESAWPDLTCSLSVCAHAIFHIFYLATPVAFCFLKETNNFKGLPFTFGKDNFPCLFLKMITCCLECTRWSSVKWQGHAYCNVITINPPILIIQDKLLMFNI